MTIVRALGDTCIKANLCHLVVATGLALLCTPVPEARATDFVWDGNGDVNDGGNWSDPANWDVGAGYPDDTNDTATLPLPSVVRYITNDVATTIDTLTMSGSANNRIVLDADLTALTINGGGNNWQDFINLNSNRLTVSMASALYHPKMQGAGEFTKAGVGTVVMTSSDASFVGGITASNGLLRFRSAVYPNATNVTVVAGATVRLETAGNLPDKYVINGDGFNNQGALRTQNQSITVTNIHLASDSRIANGSAATTMTIGSPLEGTNRLCLVGPGKIDLVSTNYGFSGTLCITNGTVTVPGELVSVTNIVVQNGGVLVGSVVHFPSVVVGPVTNVTVEAGGTWIQAGIGIWTGNGDPNNSGNWSDTNNWTGLEVPTYQAILPRLGVDRFVTNDVPSSVTILQLEDDANNHLVVMAPMTIGTYEPKAPSAGYFSQVDNYSTVTVSNHNSLYGFDTDKGTGTYVVVGSGTWVAQASGTFSGNWIVSNGTFKVRSADARPWSGLTAVDGTTILCESPAANRQAPYITITGAGSGADGALHNYNVSQIYSNLTLAADAIVKASTTMTFEGGYINGPGDLTKIGAQTMHISNTFNVVVSGSNANKIVASAGEVNLLGGTLAVSGEETATEREYVIVDYSGAGTVANEFAATNDLPGSWTVAYGGTVDHPNAVVLVKAGFDGTLLLIR